MISCASCAPSSVSTRLVLMADEVYQENIYQSKTPFVSCKKVSC